MQHTPTRQMQVVTKAIMKTANQNENNCKIFIDGKIAKFEASIKICGFLRTAALHSIHTHSMFI